MWSVQVLSQDRLASIILSIWTWVAPVPMSQDTQEVTVTSLLIRWVMQEFPACRLKIETVAAGGGSICRIDDKLLRVGPESAGAYPGPACYGFGGPFCLTDVNLLLGRLSIRHFSTPVFVEAAQEKLDELISETGELGKIFCMGS